MLISGSYIDDDASAPVVQTPVVALIPQNFRGEVGRGAHNGFSKALFTNDPREAKVTQFYLEAQWFASELSCGQ